ncbi:unnamed protein product [Ilex paraguariensis]|uniref:XS domain-containing protein n=1 Tax=Ilex paraguariensis TaxID=185542 RepID=A0ABC8SKM9_9AQUA
MFLENDLSNEAEPQRQRVVASAPAEQNSEYNDLYVWPWTGIFVNIVNEPKNWEAVGSEGYWLAKFSKYKPSGIEIFLDDQGLVAQAVVKFDNDWTGFKNAMEFEKFFETEHHSKKEWNVEESHHNSNIYGWIAREDDYNSEGPVGDYLRRKGVLKTIPNLVQEATQHKNYIVANRANEIDMKTENLDELQIKYNEKTLSLSRMLRAKDILHSAFCEGSLSPFSSPSCSVCAYATMYEKMSATKCS